MAKFINVTTHTELIAMYYIHFKLYNTTLYKLISSYVNLAYDELFENVSRLKFITILLFDCTQQSHIYIYSLIPNTHPCPCPYKKSGVEKGINRHIFHGLLVKNDWKLSMSKNYGKLEIMHYIVIKCAI